MNIILKTMKNFESLYKLTVYQHIFTTIKMWNVLL